MRKKPRRFQRIGARWIEKFNGRALLSDQMGLGKTLQAILWMRWFLNHGPVVVVCPATIKTHWLREIKENIDLDPVILEGKKPKPRGLKARKERCYIINYDILGKPEDPDSWVNYLREVNPTLIIGDEVHYIKTRTSQRTKSFRHLCNNISKVILISGTPLTNRPAELWPALNILQPQLFDSFYSYGSRYCSPRKTPWGWQYTGATNLDELHHILKQTCMIRRLKKDVLEDMPVKTRSIVPMEIKNFKIYKEAETDFVRWLRRYNKKKATSAQKAERLVQMGYLRRLAAQLKIDSIIKWIENYLEESDEKIIMFGIHKILLGTLRQKFHKLCVFVDGSVRGVHRQAAIDQFNSDKHKKIFFGNIQAAGVGWSCKSTSVEGFMEFPWTPGEMIQAEDRIHGIGRGTGKENATYYNLVAEGTIEEKLVQLLAQKQLILDQTMDGKAGAAEFDLLDRLSESLIRGA